MPENCAASALSKYLREDARKWGDREPWDTEESEQDLGDHATFFPRDKQGLFPIIGQIYKCKARRNGLTIGGVYTKEPKEGEAKI